MLAFYVDINGDGTTTSISLFWATKPLKSRIFIDSFLSDKWNKGSGFVKGHVDALIAIEVHYPCWSSKLPILG